MSYKRIIGIIIVLIGILLIFFSFYIKSRVAYELHNVKTKTELLERHPFARSGGKTSKQIASTTGKAANQIAQERAASYQTTAMWLLISGIVVIIVGALIIVFGRSRPSSKE